MIDYFTAKSILSIRAEDTVSNLDDLDQVIQVNEFFTQNIDNVEESVPKDAYEKMMEHIELFRTGKFDWIKEQHSTNTIRKLTRDIFDFKNNTRFQRENQERTDERLMLKKYEQINPAFMQKLFKITTIQGYLRHPDFSFGKPVYDNALRLHTELLMIFNVFYLRADYKNIQKIDTTKLKIIDPLTRIHIRTMNRNDPDLTKKYFNKVFDLKKFLKQVLDDFFPNVTWRYLGAGHHANRLALEIINFMFEIGLWEIDDLEDLLKLLTLKIENLNKLELVCISDGPKLGVAFKKELFNHLSTCKQNVSEIILHIIVLINDHALTETLPWKSSLGSKALKNKNLWKESYFNQKQMNDQIHPILINYIMEKRKLNDWPLSTIQVDKNISTIFNILSDVNLDLTIMSMEFVDEKVVRYYHQVDLKNQSTNIYRQEAQEIKTDLEELIEMIYEGKFGKQMELGENKKLIGAVEQIIADLSQKFMNKNQQEIEDRQLSFSETGVTILLLQLASIICNTNLIQQTLKILYGISQICKNNYVAQSLLFTFHGYTFYKRIIDSKPLWGMLITQKIFEDDNLFLYVNPEIFGIFMSFYEGTLDNFCPQVRNSSASWNFSYEEFKKDAPKYVQSMLSLFTFNQFLEKILPNHNIQLSNVKRYDLAILEKIKRMVIDHMLPFIADSNNLVKFDNADQKEPGKDKYNFDFQLMETDSEVIINLSRKESFSETELRNLMYEISLSFLRLFNKCSSEYYFANEYKKIKEFFSYDPFTRFDYFYDFKEGIYFKMEILKLFNNFKVFFNNHLLDNRATLNAKPGILFLQRMIPDDHRRDTIVNLIIQEMEKLDKVLIIQKANKSPYMDALIDRYIYKAFLPMIYKYTNGIYTMFHNDDEPDSVNQVYEAMNKLFGVLKDKTSVITQIIKNQDAIDLNLKIISEMEEDTNNEKEFIDMEPEEILYPVLYKLRKKSEIILEVIERIYPENLSYQINRYTRTCAMKRKKNNLSQGSQNIIRSSVQINRSKVERMQTTSRRDYENTERYPQYNDFKFARDSLKKLKNDYIHFEDRENYLIEYLQQTSANAITIIEYFMKSFFDAFKKEFLNKESFDANQADSDTKVDDDYIFKEFLKSESIYASLVFLDNVISGSDTLRRALYDNLNKPNEELGIYVLDRKKIIFVMYHLSLEFGQFVNFQPFQTRAYAFMWERYYTLTNLFKNMCENNNSEFKRWMSKNKPKIQTHKMSGRDWTLIFDFYVRKESYANNNRIWKNKQSRLALSDRPETFDSVIRFFDVITEFVNGPCPFNQRMIYRYRIDMWMGYIRRMIDDVNSKFYFIKDRSIEYITSLMEGEGFTELDTETKAAYDKNPLLVTEFMVANITPTIIIDLIKKMLKKLYAYTYLKKNPGVKKDLVEKMIRNRTEKRLEEEKLNLYRKNDTVNTSTMSAEIKNNFNEAARRKEIYIQEKSKFEMTSQHEDSDAIIPDDLEEMVKLTHMNQLKNLYFSDVEFSNHIIITICLKLYSILANFSKLGETSSANLFKQEKDREAYVYYKDSFDKDDIDTELLTSIKERGQVKKHKLPTEEITCYSFIQNISMEVEVRITDKSPELEKPQKINKILIFKKEPECFFLVRDTKNKFAENIDLSNKVSYLQSSFRLFFKEMNNNRAFYLWSPFFYNISTNDAFRYQKIFIWFLGLILNFLVLYFYDLNDSFKLDSGDGKWAIIGLSAFIAFYSFINFVLWAILRYPNEKDLQVELFKVRYPLDDPTELKNAIIISVYHTFLGQAHAVNFMFHFLFAILGASLYPVFHTIHLLLIINISVTAKYVVDASTRHIDQLAITFILAVFFIWTYSVLTADYFSQTFDSMDVGDDNPVCATLAGCFAYVTNLGLRNGGGIADSMELYKLEDTKFYPKLIFDLTFFILVNVISLNIIFGIIIDQFGDMRGKLDDRSKK